MSSAFMSRHTKTASNEGLAKPNKARIYGSSFLAILSRVFNTLYYGGLHFFKRIRSFLWIGSTALIFLMIPIAYSTISQSELEYIKLERATEMASGRAVRGSF